MRARERRFAHVPLTGGARDAARARSLSLAGTLNEDGLTASCGCQSMPADKGNPTIVSLTEGLMLASNAHYRQLITDCADSGCTDIADSPVAEKLCQDISTGAVWPTLSSDVGILTSFYSINPLYSAAAGFEDKALICPNDVMCASCQGSPCYQKEYESPVFDLTCICPVKSTEGPDGPQGTHCGITELASNGDGDVCTEIDASGYRSCGASSQLNSTYLYESLDAVRDMVDAVRAAKPLGNHTQCPSYGTELPKWSGTHAIDDDEPYSPLSTTKGTISTNLSHTAPSTANQSFAKHDD